MHLLEKLTNMYLKFNRKMLFDAGRLKRHREMRDQQHYLEKMKIPKDEFERAYIKFKCHAYYHLTWPIRAIYNCMGIFMLPVFSVVLALRSLKQQFVPFEPNGAIIIVSPTMKCDDILPPQVERDYGELKRIKPLSITDRCMDKKAWRIFGKCFGRYWMHPYFCLEALIRIAGTCQLIYRYTPKATVAYGRERDFIVPILYEYSKSLGVDMVSFMHGVFVYSIDKAFITFTKYYVWEPYYVDMFTRLKARSGSLEVYKPQKFEPKVQPRPEGVPYDFFMTYYFTSESEERMERIKTCLDLLTSKGLICKLRPHPRFTDPALLERVFKGYLIENKDWTLEKSMECSRFIAAYNSTVLTEAYYSSKEIVIDNYVDPSKFQNMIDRDYIMLSRPHQLMTDVIQEYCGVTLDTQA